MYRRRIAFVYAPGPSHGLTVPDATRLETMPFAIKTIMRLAAAGKLMSFSGSGLLLTTMRFFQRPSDSVTNHEFARASLRRGTPPPQIIPNAFGERAVLKLMFGALIRAAERWRSAKVTEFERRQMTAVRKQLDEEYEAAVGLNVQP
jgi:hypothetical protein